MSASQERQSEVIDVENLNSSSGSSDDDSGTDELGHVTQDNIIACFENAVTDECVQACDEPCKIGASGREMQECCYGGGKKHPRRKDYRCHGRGFWGHHGKWGDHHGRDHSEDHHGGDHHGGGRHGGGRHCGGRHGGGRHGDHHDGRHEGRRFKRFRHDFGYEPWAVSDSSDEKFKCKKFMKKHGVFKALKKSMKEAKKYRKAAKCTSGQGGKCRKGPKDSLREDIYVYMGDFMANEVSVTLTEGKVKITGNHSSKNAHCRSHSVVHMYAAPQDTDSNLIKAIYYPRGMLLVRFLERDEEPIELPVGDDVTVAGDAIAEMRVDEQ